ncbi:ChrA protein [Paenibacillus selenitireducens]|uniref:ChrA protein n=1 Tax=Paenibacillus selenitireducens TaxID=1324314 RepID=A0A1T2XHQ0_9BACL|nr:chromate transporter [Paenibacillus selenitireducens]OPA79335.1 ChrA protein [Paenibacillus selenitireducens]
MKRTLNTAMKSILEVFWVSTKLGLTSFGGPVAHLGYFHEEYVRRRQWIEERRYADLVALCQFLPGPASSQVGIGIGVMRAGILGGVAAFLGFTLPSVIMLILFAWLLHGMDMQLTGLIHGLKIVAVVVVAHAVLGMAQKLTPDRTRRTIAALALIISLLWPATYTQVGIILGAALLGLLWCQQGDGDIQPSTVTIPISRRWAWTCLTLFFGLLMILPILREMTSSYWIAFVDSFYRAGSLVFGGGHVVLPLLEREFVPTGWISKADFLTGYGVTQAVPGPLFTFAAYVGTIMHGWIGGIVATLAIFLPAFLLIVGTLPFWDKLRHHATTSAALHGVNAAVVGILTAALYTPIWTSSILSSMDFALGAALFSMLVFWKLPPWVIVITGALGGFLLSAV